MPTPHSSDSGVLNTRTTTRLLNNLRDTDNVLAWEGFDARYPPILIAFARCLGFTGEDTVELAQQTLAEIASAYAQGRYQRGQGRLSSWLIGIACNNGSGLRRRAARDRTVSIGDEDAWADKRLL